MTHWLTIKFTDAEWEAIQEQLPEAQTTHDFCKLAALDQVREMYLADKTDEQVADALEQEIIDNWRNRRMRRPNERQT